MSVLVGGVGQLFQGDLDLGRLAAERLAAEWPTGECRGPDVLVEDLHYGGVAVAHRLEELRPEALVLVGAAVRGRVPGTVHRRRVHDPELSVAEVRRAVEEAATGYVTIDLVIEVGAGLEVLPRRTVAIELEPVEIEPAERLTPAAEEGLEVALDLVRAEVRRLPLLSLADDLRAVCQEGHLRSSPALDTLLGLLGELEQLDEEGRWGAAFALRDRLRRRISSGETPEGMGHLDWGLWWALVEELDRLQPLEAETSLG